MSENVGFTIDKKSKAKLKRLVVAYKDASVAASWAGGGDPRDIPFWEKHAKKTKKELYDFINQKCQK